MEAVALHDPDRIDWSHRFWKFVTPEALSGCWLWGGCVAGKGYGYFRHTYKGLRAHRHAFALCNGPIPDGALVCHRCDVPACVNPAHLFLGSHQVNYDDMVAKGRSADFGSHRAVLLTEEQVRAIWRLGMNGRRAWSIAEAVGCSPTHVAKVLRREVWAHLDMEAGPRRQPDAKRAWGSSR